MGTGTVIGLEAKQVLIKHRGTYVRVHPCWLMHHLNRIKHPVVNSDSDTVGNPEVVHGNFTNNPTQDDIEEEYLMPEESGNNVD